MNGRVSKMKNTRGLLASELAATQDLQDSFRVVKERMEIAATIRRVWRFRGQSFVDDDGDDEGCYSGG